MKKAPVIVINASLEAELSVLSPEEQIEFLQELEARQSGLDKLIAAGHTLLDLETFYTAGPKESRAWSVRKNATAPQAAGVIHTDFESPLFARRLFAQVIILNIMERLASKAGKWRLEGKELPSSGWRYSSYSCKCIAHHYRLTNINRNFSPI